MGKTQDMHEIHAEEQVAQEAMQIAAEMFEPDKFGMDFDAGAGESTLAPACQAGMAKVAMKAAEILSARNGKLMVCSRPYSQTVPKMQMLREFSRASMYDGPMELNPAKQEVFDGETVKSASTLLMWEEHMSTTAVANANAISTQFLETGKAIWGIVNCANGRLYVGFEGEMKNSEYKIGIVFAEALYLARHHEDFILWQSADTLEAQLFRLTRNGEATYLFGQLRDKMVKLVKEFD